MLPVPTRQDLVTFTGRPAATFNTFAEQALAQATLMFTFVTHLDALPDDPDQAQLANNAILELADRLILEQPHKEIMARPYQSESIASWSYSRLTPSAKAAQSGGRTGLFWWDLAVEELQLASASVVAHGSVAIETPGVVQDSDGSLSIRGPADGDGELAPTPYIRIS